MRLSTKAKLAAVGVASILSLTLVTTAHADDQRGPCDFSAGIPDGYDLSPENLLDMYFHPQNYTYIPVCDPMKGVILPTDWQVEIEGDGGQGNGPTPTPTPSASPSATPSATPQVLSASTSPQPSPATLPDTGAENPAPVLLALAGSAAGGAGSALLRKRRAS